MEEQINEMAFFYYYSLFFIFLNEKVNMVREIERSGMNMTDLAM